MIRSGPIVLVGGSNGCSVAVRLVLAQTHSVVGLVLAWPATAGNFEPTGFVDELTGFVARLA